MLSKQSIRKDHTIYYNGDLTEKSVILELSKEFSEIETQRFKKMLQQGGRLKVKGNVFEIVREDNKMRNSKGDFETPVKKSIEEQEFVYLFHILTYI